MEKDLNNLLGLIKNSNIKQLSKDSGVPAQTIRRIIKGESSPCFDTLDKMLSTSKDAMLWQEYHTFKKNALELQKNINFYIKKNKITQKDIVAKMGLNESRGKLWNVATIRRVLGDFTTTKVSTLYKVIDAVKAIHEERERSE